MDLCPHCEEDTLFDTRQRVFCASLADVFEDNPQLANWRGELFDLIEATPNLDWLLLTKRPERIFSLGTDAVGEVFDNWMARNPHVWLGTSVESQEHFIPRTTELLKTYAKIHWLSVEPMIRPVRFIPWTNQIDWVICGGESGSKYRPMDLEWARDLRDDCRNLSISFFMKQLGGHPNKRDSMSDFPEDLRIREFPPVKENGYQ
jgi:protein gp37